MNVTCCICVHDGMQTHDSKKYKFVIPYQLIARQLAMLFVLQIHTDCRHRIRPVAAGFSGPDLEVSFLIIVSCAQALHNLASKIACGHCLII
jgi:hypothetical protein